MLSTPKSTSPSGLPAVSAALLTTSPASPVLTSVIVMPVRAVKSASRDFVSAKESCVMSVTVVGANDEGTVLGAGAVAVAVLVPVADAHALSRAAAPTTVTTRPRPRGTRSRENGENCTGDHPSAGITRIRFEGRWQAATLSARRSSELPWLSSCAVSLRRFAVVADAGRQDASGPSALWSTAGFSRAAFSRAAFALTTKAYWSQ